MSLYDYQQSITIASQDYPFYALIMAAMRQADTANLAELRYAFPAVYEELVNRYSAPGGALTEKEADDATDQDMWRVCVSRL